MGIAVSFIPLSATPSLGKKPPRQSVAASAPEYVKKFLRLIVWSNTRSASDNTWSAFFES